MGAQVKVQGFIEIPVTATFERVAEIIRELFPDGDYVYRQKDNMMRFSRPIKMDPETVTVH